LGDMSLFAISAHEVVGSEVGAQGQQKVLTERCLEDQALDRTLCWTLEEPAYRTSGKFHRGLNLGIPQLLIDRNAIRNGGRSLGGLSLIANALRYEPKGLEFKVYAVVAWDKWLLDTSMGKLTSK